MVNISNIFSLNMITKYIFIADIETTLSTQHEEHDSTHQDADTTINDVSGMADSTSKDNFQSELTEEPVAVGKYNLLWAFS